MTAQPSLSAYCPQVLKNLTDEVKGYEFFLLAVLSRKHVSSLVTFEFPLLSASGVGQSCHKARDLTRSFPLRFTWGQCIRSS